MTSPIDPTNQSLPHAPLDVVGAVPVDLAGRLVGIGRDGVVHSFRFHRGRVAYAAHDLHMDAAALDLVAFEGSVLVHADDSSVSQLSADLRTLRRVDLAGHRRPVVSRPRYDPSSGELHLVARDASGAQLHVVVPAGALTRRSRPILEARARALDLAIGSDHLVVIADGVIGVAPRDGEMRTTWTPTDAAAPLPIHTHRVGDAIVLLALTPSLEQWTLDPDGSGIEREVLDATPRRCAHVGGHGADGAPRWAWTSGDESIALHDLVESRHVHLDLRPGQPDDFVVAHEGHPDRIDRGWLIGLVHDQSAMSTDLRVRATNDITSVAAVVRVPRPIPRGLHCTWMPAPSNDPSPTPSPREDQP